MLRLPTADGRPLDSPELVRDEEPAAAGKVSLQAWLVPTVELDPAEALESLAVLLFETVGASVRHLARLAEFARDRRFKLTRQGKLFDVSEGDDESKPVKRDSLDEAGRADVAKLQAALDRYRDVRPERIVAQAGKKGTE